MIGYLVNLLLEFDLQDDDLILFVKYIAIIDKSIKMLFGLGLLSV